MFQTRHGIGQSEGQRGKARFKHVLNVTGFKLSEMRSRLSDIRSELPARRGFRVVEFGFLFSQNHECSIG